MASDRRASALEPGQGLLGSRLSGVLKFWPGDDRGEEILDELEERFELTSQRFDRVREYYIAASGKVDLTGWLDQIDPSWRAHIEAQTK